MVARTYRVDGITPEDVVDHFARALPADGWRTAEPVHRSDTEARSGWVTDEWRLEVERLPVSDGQDPTSAEHVVQHGLVLRPR